MEATAVSMTGIAVQTNLLALNAAIEAACGTEQVTMNIGDLRQGSGEPGSAATQVLGTARTLATRSDRLSRSVQNFLADVRAA